ncbi:MAG: NAD-dependent epimerase/dehydratase family protein [Candidatus Eremiobacteraeota bacterium]|nr:NAD-dependent epimerase/dehydratase family protein [Candidatus Eremiobacteraeota bacterium]
MRVLVLGGTVFLGRHVVETLLARGHEVTLFHRGKRGLELFPNAERVLGDRATDLDRLPAGARWDAVVDTSTSLPGYVRTSADALLGRAGRYVFVSSVSAYDISLPSLDESSRLLELPDGASRDIVEPETYGALKVLCEREAVAAFGAERTFIVRPGLIVGPHDPTDRFTYWPLRFARGGDVVVPDDLDAPVQWIDVRDLAEFVVDALERERSGTVNTVGPAEPATLRILLEACAAVAGTPSRLVPVDLATLKKRGIEGWTDLPVWVTPNDGADGVARVDRSRALALGMRHRSLETTVADTLRWAQNARGDAPLKAGLTPQREAELLALAAH